MTIPRDERSRTRSDLARDQAWAISVGGIGVVLFTALLAFTWYFAPTLLLIFPGWLQHSVQPNRSEEFRVSISFNMGFRRKGG